MPRGTQPSPVARTCTTIDAGQLADDRGRLAWRSRMTLLAFAALPWAPAATVAQPISAGQLHTCAILTSGELKCWGDSNSGRTGYDTTVDIGDGMGTSMATLPAVDLGAGRTAAAVSAGDSHTCAILDSGDVKCWGFGGGGRTGYDTSVNIGDGVGVAMAGLATVDLGAGRTAVRIAAGGQHTCAILDTGDVKCWGSSAAGRTGYDTTTNIGDGMGTAMTDLPAVDLGVGRTAVEISAGLSHTCAILDTGAVKCWGDSAQGRTGYDSMTDIGDGVGVAMASLPVVDLGAGRTAVEITAGLSHTCAVLDNGDLKCWGDSGNGRTGYDTETDIGDGTGTLMSALAAVDLGSGRTAVRVAAGNAYSCAILDTGDVKCWGFSAFGRTGYDSTTTIGDGVGTAMAVLPTVDLGTSRTALEVTTGNSHTCAILNNHAVKCWGASNAGQTGYDSTTHIGDGVGIAMASLGAVALGGPANAGHVFSDGFESSDLTAWSAVTP